MINSDIQTGGDCTVFTTDEEISKYNRENPQQDLWGKASKLLRGGSGLYDVQVALSKAIATARRKEEDALQLFHAIKDGGWGLELKELRAKVARVEDYIEYLSNLKPPLDTINLALVRELSKVLDG